jgi:hypothetical protein
MPGKKITRRAGQCYTYDFQADVYGGAYSLVERVGPNRWLCVNLPPSEAEIAAIMADTSAYADAEWSLRTRWARVGETFETQFVSAAKYASYF